MKFRPCIDIHNGKVKQIVGGSLKDAGDQAKENFVSGQDAAFYAELYKNAGLKGGHVILLNGKDSEYYEATRNQALKALRAYPGGLQIGGGVCPENAQDYLNAGASHVIVTSYVFRDGHISWKNLEKMVEQGLVAKYNVDGTSSACFEYLGAEEHCHKTSCFHCKCEKCGKLIHLHCEDVVKLEQHLMEKHGFQMNACRTVFYGICEECRKAEAVRIRVK